MTPEDSKILSNLEESQEALRRSIESARMLSEESDRLIRQYRDQSDPEALG